MRKKVVFCTDGIFPHAIGGMQRHSRLLIEALAKMSSFELIVIHPHKKLVFDSALGIHEISVSGIDPEKNYLLECYRYSKRIYSVIKQQPDAVIYSQGLSVWYKCDQIRDRLIVNPHGLESYQGLTKKDKLIGFPFRQIFNYLFSNSRYVISLGGQLTDILNANTRDQRKIVTIPNAVTAPAEAMNQRHKSSSEPIQVLFVSRFAANKGINVLMEAISKLNSEGYDSKFSFKLAGKGPLWDYYTSNYRFSNIEYLGFIDDEMLEDLYNTSDVFVLPTLFEGMPTVVLEAMAKGLPIIVSDTGATAELVDSSNGYLIPKNNVQEFYQALVNFSHLTEVEKSTMSNKSIEKVIKNFTWDKVALATIRLINNTN